jgi:putative phage-type endonuclease
MKILNVVQGTPEWLAVRAEPGRRTASEAAAMMGDDPNTTRNELLHMKATGNEREFTEWVRKNILDKGHEVEALARPIAEKMLGQDLYPITVSDGNDYLLASLDGATDDTATLFEHKQWNEATVTAMRSTGRVPLKHHWQIQQGLLITGAARCLFMVSDGTEQNCETIMVEPDQLAQDMLLAGWKQFDADLANYVPPEVIPAVVAAPQAQLPAVSVQVEGSIAIIDNLSVFGDALRAYVERINTKPETDQDFADLDATAKKLREAEAALTAAENNALGQASSIDTLRRTVAEYRDLARTNRLMVEKLVNAEKENRRNAIIRGGKDAYDAHILALNTRIGTPLLSSNARNIPEPDFAGKAKGLRTISSIQNAIDTELARVKIESSAIADRIEINLRTLHTEAAEYPGLFHDKDRLVFKAPDDLIAAIKSRIAEHKAVEANRLEAERTKIRAEEQAKAEAKAKAEQEAANVRDATSTAAAMVATQAASAAAAFGANGPTIDPGGAARQFNDARSEQIAAIPTTVLAPASPTMEAKAPANAALSEHARALLDTVAVAPSVDTGIRIKLGDINARLAPLALTADGLAQLGFPAVGQDRAAKLYRACDFPAICMAIINHIQGVAGEEMRKAA